MENYINKFLNDDKLKIFVFDNNLASVRNILEKATTVDFEKTNVYFNNEYNVESDTYSTKIKLKSLLSFCFLFKVFFLDKKNDNKILLKNKEFTINLFNKVVKDLLSIKDSSDYINYTLDKEQKSLINEMKISDKDPDELLKHSLFNEDDKSYFMMNKDLKGLFKSWDTLTELININVKEITVVEELLDFDYNVIKLIFDTIKTIDNVVSYEKEKNENISKLFF